MSNVNLGAVARVLAVAVLAVALWFATKYGYAKPHVLGADAPAAEFSAGRAYDTLGRLLGPEKPHPVSSDENAAVRARIQAEFARLGVKTSTYKAFACNAWRGFAAVPCATTIDIVAEIVPGEGKAIVLLAHYNSVPAGPGASDDESGVATVLETARALKARGGKSLHPVIGVITDGEEAGLLGAEAFLQNKDLKARVGAVVNVEARGTTGRSLLFQTSPADSKLIDLYAAHVPFTATSSLFAEIYRLLPNDTDLTLFIKQGFPSFNFAFSDNVADYHTPFDRRANLSRLTLQEQGSNMLGVATALEQTPYDGLKGHGEVYLDILGYAVPRMPASWALPAAIVSLLLLLFAAWRAKDVAARDWVRAALLPPAMLIACGAIGWALHTIAQLICGQPDPSYAYPIALREGLAFGVAAMVLLTARMADARAAALGAWIWFAVLSVLTAAFLPGISPYFLFPAMLAALAALTGNRWAFVVPMLAAGVIWIGLVATGEGLMGLKLHPLFTVPAAFAAMTMVSLIDVRSMSRGAWQACLAVAVVRRAHRDGHRRRPARLQQDDRAAPEHPLRRRRGTPAAVGAGCQRALACAAARGREILDRAEEGDRGAVCAALYRPGRRQAALCRAAGRDHGRWRIRRRAPRHRRAARHGAGGADGHRHPESGEGQDGRHPRPASGCARGLRRRHADRLRVARLRRRSRLD